MGVHRGGLNTLIITDIDAKDADGKAVPPARGASLKARNETLKTWIPEEESLDALLDMKPEEVVLSDPSGYGVRVAYQQPIQAKFKSEKAEEALANTFEDALVYENIELFTAMKGVGLMRRLRMSLDAAADLGDLAKRVSEDLAEGGKAEFAMALLYGNEIDTMQLPAYIDAGLLWLAEQLKRKEDSIDGKVPVAATAPAGAVAEKFAI